MREVEISGEKKLVKEEDILVNFNFTRDLKVMSDTDGPMS
jgi:hypothetical protein